MWLSEKIGWVNSNREYFLRRVFAGGTCIRYVYKCVELSCYIVEEFSQTHLTPRWDLSYDERLKPARIPADAPADSFDWRDHGVVTPVKNQV